MKNQLKHIGTGFKYEKSLFGVSINGWSVVKFTHKDGRIAIALEKNDVISTDEYVYRFNDKEAFQNWIDSIHEVDGQYLHHQDGGLICRCYPVFNQKKDDAEYF